MTIGRAIIAVVLTVSCGSAFAKENAAVRVGDLVVVEMTGELAKEYAARTGMPRPEKFDAAGMNVSTVATVAQQRSDGKYRIECSSTIENTKSKPRMLTLDAIVERNQLRNQITPKGTLVYASPGDAKSGKGAQKTKSDESLLHVELSDLRSAKLRTWALVDEVGN